MKRLTLIPVIFLTLISVAHAGEGHDHGDAPPAVNSNGPKRLPDGGVFLPKPAQRQISVRTLLVESGALPRAFELAGKALGADVISLTASSHSSAWLGRSASGTSISSTSSTRRSSGSRCSRPRRAVPWTA